MLGVKNKTDAEFDALQNKMISSVSAKDTDKLKKAMNFPDGKIRIRTIISSDGTKNYTLVQENFALLPIYVETASFLVN